MNEVLVISKGQPQSKAFERYMDDYTAKNNLPIKWIYANDKEYLDVIANNDIKYVIISPEVIIVMSKIKAELEAKNMNYLEIKPAAFGLRQTEKFMPQVLEALGLN